MGKDKINEKGQSNPASQYRLDGKTALFVGGGSGMGKAGAAAAYAAGADVILVGRNLDTLQKAKAEIEVRVGTDNTATTSAVPTIRTELLDITDETAVSKFFDGFADGDGVDHIVVTAGPSNGTSSINGPTGFAGLKAQIDMKMLAQLCVVSYGSTKVRTGGSIVLTSGVLAQRPGAGSTALAVANAGLEAAAKGLANDLGPSVRVNVLSPGLTNTEIWDKMPPEKRDAMLKGFGSTLPLKRSGESDDMGHAILFLLTSTYVTGLTIQVDGGALIRP